jgi:hypothetical protein
MTQHTTPCKECPWRKNSAPGWLGASTPEQFIAQAEAGIKMPCHCAVNYERADWKEQSETAPRCAGHAIYLRNRCKMPIEPGLAAFVRTVEPSPAVFTRPEQFLSHHNGDPTRAMGILIGIDNGDPR